MAPPRPNRPKPDGEATLDNRAASARAADGNARDLITDLFGLSGFCVIVSGLILLVWVPALTHVPVDQSVATATYSLSGLSFTGWGVRKTGLLELILKRK